MSLVDVQMSGPYAEMPPKQLQAMAAKHSRDLVTHILLFDFHGNWKLYEGVPDDPKGPMRYVVEMGRESDSGRTMLSVRIESQAPQLLARLAVSMAEVAHQEIETWERAAAEDAEAEELSRE